MEIAFCLFGLPRFNKNTIFSLIKISRSLNFNTSFYAHCWDFNGYSNEMSKLPYHSSKDNNFNIKGLYTLLAKNVNLRGFKVSKQDILNGINDTEDYKVTRLLHMVKSVKESLDLMNKDIITYERKIDYVIFTRYDLLFNSRKIVEDIKKPIKKNQFFHSGHINHDNNYSAEDLIYGMPLEKTNGLFDRLEINYKKLTYYKRKIYNPLLYELKDINKSEITNLSGLIKGNIFIRRFNQEPKDEILQLYSLTKFSITNFKNNKLIYSNKIWHKIRRIRSEKARYLQIIANKILRRKRNNIEEIISFIKRNLQNNKPFFIGRLGNVETRTFLKTFKEYISKAENIYYSKACGAKFHNKKDYETGKYLYLSSLSDCDCIGLWDFVYKEGELVERIANKDTLKFNALDLLKIFFRRENDITKLLNNKSICIVNSDIETIKESLKKSIMKENNFWDSFNNKYFIKSINPHDNESTWIEEFDRLKKQVNNLEVDIYLLSCGSFSQPLGAYIKKNLNKSAINLGSLIQLITGTPGQRYKYDSEYKKYFEKINNNCLLDLKRKSVSKSLLETERSDYI